MRTLDSIPTTSKPKHYPNLEKDSSEAQNVVKSAYSLTREQLEKITSLLNSSSNSDVSQNIELYNEVGALIKNLVKENDEKLSPQYGASINLDERIACVAVGIIICSIARADSQTAVAETARRFDWQPYEDGNEGNAFQHAYWNALMNKHVGGWAASTIATAHETGSPSYGTLVSQMDLYNNNVGRQIQYYNQSLSDWALGNLVYDYDRWGYMYIMEKHYWNRLVPSNTYSYYWPLGY
ncbi:hypothetical protein V3W47_13715 [Deinococcus sp. YIM 134068]|uniref:DUF6973 domain-containing protein n=1 Tax=Deinococcus lichenicola TaxID=3118910 RepID=UPI002F9456F1